MKSCKNCIKQDVCKIMDDIAKATANGYAAFAQDAIFAAVGGQCMAYVERGQ